MAIIFFDERSGGCFFIPYLMGPSSLLRFLTIFRARGLCPDDQMCPSCVPDPRGISPVGMNGEYLKDPDSDDEAKNYSRSELMILERLLLSPIMILQKGEAVLRVAAAPLVVEVEDDLPFPSPVVDVGSDSSSSSPIVEAHSDLQYLSSWLVENPTVSIPSQDEEEGDVRGCKVGAKVAQKRGLPEEGARVDSRGTKKSRAVLPQEASGSDQFFLQT
ncbi:hypothetical protein Adt_31201 [Abeliophyllum distichum]|uniref:Uncharacterized protein n=1 Tax=Abeliophyllum distichum TaxID=126358 RepID=A0ABD1RDG8_9LAMI